MTPVDSQAALPDDDHTPPAEALGNGGVSNVYANDYHPPLATPTSGYATASLLCGLGTFVSLGLSGILAVIFGHLAIRETKTGQRAGHGMAITGLILGYLSIAGWAAFALILIIGAIGAGAAGGTQ